jgi:hypothetical protein
MAENTELIQGLLDKLGAADAEAEQLRASVASLQSRWMAERALADELAGVLRRCVNSLAAPEDGSEADKRAERELAEDVLTVWEQARHS